MVILFLRQFLQIKIYTYSAQHIYSINMLYKYIGRNKTLIASNHPKTSKEIVMIKVIKDIHGQNDPEKDQHAIKYMLNTTALIKASSHFVINSCNLDNSLTRVNLKVDDSSLRILYMRPIFIDRNMKHKLIVFRDITATGSFLQLSVFSQCEKVIKSVT